MSKRNTTAPRTANPALPSALLELDGFAYQLVYDYRAIAEAEAACNQGKPHAERVNLLMGFTGATAATLPGLFWAALRRHHPKITLEDAIDLIRPDNVYRIANAVAECYDLAQPERGRKDPTGAGGSSQPAGES